MDSASLAGSESLAGSGELDRICRAAGFQHLGNVFLGNHLDKRQDAEHVSKKIGKHNPDHIELVTEFKTISEQGTCPGN